MKMLDAMRMTTAANIRGHLAAAVLPATLLASVLAFTACGGGSSGVADTTQPPPSPVALQASPPGALLGYIQGKLSAQVDKGQDFQSYNGFYRGGQIVDFMSVTTASAEAGGKSFSSTTLQEGGVDEADLMKTDGSRVFSLTVDTPGSWRLNTLRVDRRLSDGSLQADGNLALSSTDSIEGIHVAARGERVALLGQSEQWYTLAGLTTQVRTLDASFAPTPMTPPQTVVGLVDVKTGQKLTQTHSIRIDGQMVDSRMIGDTLYVVTSWYPRLDIVPLSGSCHAGRSQGCHQPPDQPRPAAHRDRDQPWRHRQQPDRATDG
ncbi:MAG: beta-propeller domain-containing protein [Rhodoferax sp.]|nr:beta-propeller domain-containing protein [Rhodoferax sp.]